MTALASNVLKALLALGIAGGAVWLGYASRKPGTLNGGGGLPPLPPAPRQALLSPSDTYHGVSWQIHHAGHAVEEARLMLTEIADLGADTVLIGNAGYQEHAASETFKIDPAVTPSPEQWREIIGMAHANGLRVVMMPILLLSNPRGTEWRGVISPPSWDEWIVRYRDFLLHYARIAADNQVEVFMIGSELVSAEKAVPLEQWRDLIREVRKVYPGKLSYSANWDHYKNIEFWDDLDMVGMTSYYKLSSTPNPSYESLVEAWKPIQRGLLRWQAEIGKPLLFTEVGWCSQEGITIEPWNYYHDDKSSPAALEEQRRAYQAFMDTWDDEVLKLNPAVGGIIWWEWMNVPGGPSDFSYVPKGKPAERELRKWFERIREFRQQHPGTSTIPATTSAPPKANGE